MLIKPNLSGGNYFAEGNRIISTYYEGIAPIENLPPTSTINWLTVMKKTVQSRTPPEKLTLLNMWDL